MVSISFLAFLGRLTDTRPSIAFILGLVSGPGIMLVSAAEGFLLFSTIGRARDVANVGTPPSHMSAPLQYSVSRCGAFGTAEAGMQRRSPTCVQRRLGGECECGQKQMNTSVISSHTLLSSVTSMALLPHKRRVISAAVRWTSLPYDQKSDLACLAWMRRLPLAPRHRP